MMARPGDGPEPTERPAIESAPQELADFTATRRMVMLAATAIGLGVVATFVADGLLQLIALFTNAFYFQRLSFAPVSPAEALDPSRGAVSIAIPVIGALIGGVLRESYAVRGPAPGQGRDLVVGEITLHDLLKARLRHIEDEQRREQVMPFEYLLPPWLRPVRRVVQDRPG